jgi:putative two-component system response regulator
MLDPQARISILIAHHDAAVGGRLCSLLFDAGHAPQLVGNRAAALDRARTLHPDVMLVSFDVAGRDDLALCRDWRADRHTHLTPLVLVSDQADRESRWRALEAGADDFVTTPIDRAELLARVRTLARIKRHVDEMDSASAIISTLAVMVETRDGHSEGHCHRMAHYATALGRALGLGEADLQALHRGGFLHDLGMLAIPDSLLRTPGPLQPEDYALIRSHTVIGDELCGKLRSLQAIRPIVRSHHERQDGTGYPDGLAGDAVPLLAQIIGICDAFDAITSKRAYHEQQPASIALTVLQRQVELGWRSADLVAAFGELVQQGRLGTLREVPSAPVASPAMGVAATP